MERHERIKEAEKRAKKRKNHTPQETEMKDRDIASEKKIVFRQRETEEEILSRKRPRTDTDTEHAGKKKKQSQEKSVTKESAKGGVSRAADNKKFLMSLFSGGVAAGES